MEFGKRHDTSDTTDFCPRQLVTLRTWYGLVVYVADLLRTSYGEVANLLQTNLLQTCYEETGVMDFGKIGRAFDP